MYLHPLISSPSTQTADWGLETELRRTQHPHYHHHLPHPSCQLTTLSTPLYRGGWLHNIKALNWFHLSSRHNWCYMVQLSSARSLNIFWGFPIIRVGEEKYGAMCRHRMQRNCENECWICTVSPPGTAVYCTNYTLVSSRTLALLHSIHLMAASHSPIKSCVHHCYHQSRDGVSR